MRLWILPCLLTLVLSSTALAQDIDLSWGPVNVADLAGYRIYYSSISPEGPFNGMGAAEGDSPVVVTSGTTITLTDLDPNQAYYFRVSAFTTEGTESTLSNAVCNHWMPTNIYPAPGQVNTPRIIDFQWSKPEIDTSSYTYTVLYGTSNTHLSATGPLVSGNPRGGVGPYPVAIGVLILMGIMVMLRRERQLCGFGRMMLLPLAVSVLVSCGGGGSDGPSQVYNAEEPETLAPKTTYYWKVVADNGSVIVESEISSFTTGD